MKAGLLLLLLLVFIFLTPRVYGVPQGTAEYLGSSIYKVYISFPTKVYVNDTITITVRINITGETEGFMVYWRVRLITKYDYEWGVPFTHMSSAYEPIAFFLKRPAKGTVISKTFTLNATAVGVVVAVLYVQYGKWIEGKPVPVKTDSIVVATVPRVLEHGDAYAFVLTRVVDRREEQIKEDYYRLKKEYSQLSSKYNELKEKFESLRKRCESLEEERDMLRERVGRLLKLNTFYGAGFLIMLFTTLILFAYCLSLRSRVRGTGG